MSLTIKNEHTHRLVRELAEASRTSQTAAVEDAVARRLAEVRAVAGEHEARIDLALSRIRAELTEEDRNALRRTSHRGRLPSTGWADPLRGRGSGR